MAETDSAREPDDDRESDEEPPQPPAGDEPEPGKGAGRKGNFQHAPEDQRAKPDPKETDHPTPPRGR